MTGPRRDEPPAGPAPEGRRPRAWWLRPGAAATVAVVLATGLGGGMWWRMTHVSPNTPAGAEPLGAGDSAAAGGVVLVATEVEARAGAPATLAWRAVPGAAGYDVEVLTPNGALVHSAATRDTALTLPAGAAPAAGAAHQWRVAARMGDGTTRRSAPGTIRGR